MAVLVEALSVVVRRDAIVRKHPGAWQQFLAEVPNTSLCFDDELARVGFMTPPDVEKYTARLTSHGLAFHDGKKFQDLAVVDQREGPTMPVDWLSVARVSIDAKGSQVVACWLKDAASGAAAAPVPASRKTLATPAGWRFEKSLSANLSYVEKDKMQEQWKFLRSEGTNDVYLDLATGKEKFVARSSLR